jgi:hypothetical protein
MPTGETKVAFAITGEFGVTYRILKKLLFYHPRLAVRMDEGAIRCKPVGKNHNI